MKIKPGNPGRRNYAKGGAVKGYANGGMVYDWMTPEQAYLARDKEAHMSPRASDMTQSEWLNMTPDKVYPGTEYAQAWKNAKIPSR